MSAKFTQLQCKEVICVSDGRRLGFIGDILVEVPEGKVTAVARMRHFLDRSIKARTWGNLGLVWACSMRMFNLTIEQNNSSHTNSSYFLLAKEKLILPFFFQDSVLISVFIDRISIYICREGDLIVIISGLRRSPAMALHPPAT